MTDNSKTFLTTLLPITALLLFLGSLASIEFILSQQASRLIDSLAKMPALEVSSPLLSPETKLNIKFLRLGKGLYPKVGDRVKIHYRGSFEDGTEFDSSYRKKIPLEFVVGFKRIIHGMDFAILRIPLGSTAKIFIPWEMAYGENGYASVIPPKTNLLFEVELLSLEPSGIPDSMPEIKSLEFQKYEGIKIWTLQDGFGQPANPGEIISLHYVGWLQNGEVFESSYFDAKPASYSQGARAILGWKSIMRIAKPSQILFAEIPSQLAYGAQSLKGIPQNSKLFFQIQILAIEKSSDSGMENRKPKH